MVTKLGHEVNIGNVELQLDVAGDGSLTVGMVVLLHSGCTESSVVSALTREHHGKPIFGLLGNLRMRVPGLSEASLRHRKEEMEDYGQIPSCLAYEMLETELGLSLC